MLAVIGIEQADSAVLDRLGMRFPSNNWTLFFILFTSGIIVIIVYLEPLEEDE